MSSKRLVAFFSVMSHCIGSPRWIARAVQLCLIVLCALFAFLVRFEFSLPPDATGLMPAALTIWVVVKSAVFHLHRMDRGWWRFVSTEDIVRIARANLIGSVASFPLILVLASEGFPRSVYVIDFLLCFLAMSGIRLLSRLILEAAARGDSVTEKRTIIYGAGTAGVMLLRESRVNPSFGHRVVGFVDDDEAKRGSLIQGVPVLGSGQDITTIAAEHITDEVLVAIPSATGPQMARILHLCKDVAIPCRTVPGIAEIVHGRALVRQIRSINVEDLLGRSAVRLDDGAIRAKLNGNVVLVTGAAGSIGSELCRQIARFSPATIVAYDIAETPLFHLERTMAQAFPGLHLAPVIGSIANVARLAEVFQRFRPSIVYHAAAYKHVPMMELHLLEAVENNVLGTYNVASTASDYDVEQFVMISSDKAVRPTNVMGATKRVAELVINSRIADRTRFVSVRFGNVLGSNGSVIPIFREQIAAGGPITVTHPEMRRFFMTIPEAAQLVLQASTMGKGGEIFVLDMGEPIKILDLARNLILLSGLRPEQDIRIEFSGARPGEKLYEEVSAYNESTLATYHEKIKIFSGHVPSEADLRQHVERIRKFCAERDEVGVLLELRRMVSEYKPSSDLLRRISPDRALPDLGLSVTTMDYAPTPVPSSPHPAQCMN